MTSDPCFQLCVIVTGLYIAVSLGKAWELLFYSPYIDLLFKDLLISYIEFISLKIHLLKTSF